MKRTDPRLLAAARGDAPADLLFTNAKIVNVFTRTVETGAIGVVEDRIAWVGPEGDAGRVIDLAGSYVTPGLFDAHMHVESTMSPPSTFVQMAAPRGTTGVVFDPHEIANVCGLAGVRHLMADAVGLPMHIMFGASSCVPSSPLETAGAALSADDLAPLFDEPQIVALAEMMNFPGVVHGDPQVLRKVELGLRRAIVDGHAPGLTGRGLQAYIAAGVSSDHECTTAAEAAEKVRLGMRVYLREGSAARNLEALLPAVTPETAGRFCFCTDDRHPDDLLRDGHMDHVVRRAIALGLDPMLAIPMASLHPAEHYRRPDLGAIAPGRAADLVVVDDLHAFEVREVWVNGIQVGADGRYVGPEIVRDRRAAEAFHGTVRLPEAFSAASLRIAAPEGPPPRVRVIEMNPHQLVTGAGEATARVRDGAIVADIERDLLKLAVIERHRGSGAIGLGIVHGFGLRRGALASTVGHDAHNLTVVGVNDDDMAFAAQALEKAGGGQCAAADGAVLALLPLPIAGLLSEETPGTLVEQQTALLKAARSLGFDGHDPFMPLSFMPLPVIPSLKLTDLGLVDVDAFAPTTLLIDGG